MVRVLRTNKHTCAGVAVRVSVELTADAILHFKRIYAMADIQQVTPTTPTPRLITGVLFICHPQRISSESILVLEASDISDSRLSERNVVTRSVQSMVEITVLVEQKGCLGRRQFADLLEILHIETPPEVRRNPSLSFGHLSIARLSNTT